MQVARSASIFRRMVVNYGSNGNERSCKQIKAFYLGLLFVGLKLANIIAWSWWWVLLPWYYMIPLGLLVVIVGMITDGLIAAWNTIFNRSGD